MAVTVGDAVQVLTQWAPLELKESWDNPGLLVGNPKDKVTKIMTTLDVMMGTVDYAIEHGVDMIVSHHPLIMKNTLQNLRTDTYDGEMFLKLLTHHIAVFSAHTNLDSADGGVNDVMARLLQLQHTKGLVPTLEDKLYKIVVYVPESHADAVRKALGESGVGYIGNYSDCSFSVTGTGRFKAHEGTNPFIGEVGEVTTAKEERIETIVPKSKLSAVLQAMLAVHPYEEPAYDVYPLENKGHLCSMGRIGDWPAGPTKAIDVLHTIKEAFHLDVLPYAGDPNTIVSKVALLGGGGAGFIQLAKDAGADLYLTGDVKYHDAQLAVKLGIVVADGSHYGTEVPVVTDLQQRLQAVSAEKGWDVPVVVDPTKRDFFTRLK